MMRPFRAVAIACSILLLCGCNRSVEQSQMQTETGRAVPPGAALNADAAALPCQLTQGLESIRRVRLVVSVPAGETEEARAALQARAVARMHEELPQLSLDGDESDWVVEIQFTREKENLPHGAAKVPDVWAACRICVVKQIVIDNHKATAVAYQGVLHESEHIGRSIKIRPLIEELDLLDRAIAAFAVEWEKANSGDPTGQPAAKAIGDSQEAPLPDAPLTEEEREALIKIALAELEQMRIDAGQRKPVVTVEGNIATVDFPPPPMARAGSFIIKIRRDTRDIVDVKIWR